MDKLLLSKLDSLFNTLVKGKKKLQNLAFKCRGILFF
jgi:hypothetical protein